MKMRNFFISMGKNRILVLYLKIKKKKNNENKLKT